MPGRMRAEMEGRVPVGLRLGVGVELGLGESERESEWKRDSQFEFELERHLRAAPPERRLLGQGARGQSAGTGCLRRRRPTEE